MSKTLTTFLQNLNERAPRTVLTVGDPLDVNSFEVTAFLKKLDLKGVQRPVLFENVTNLDGKKSQFRLLSNLFVTRELSAAALEMDRIDHPMEVGLEMARREHEAGSTALVPRQAAPCKQRVRRGGDADVRILPVPMHHGMDAGPYLTMACVMKGLRGGFYDITFTKNMVKGPHKLSLSTHPHHHLDSILRDYESEGRGAPVIVVLGHHPAFFLSCCSLTPFGNDDYQTASAFLGEPLQLTPSETWGDDFLVPADAEIIIEGEVPPGVRENQNPFGEILGYYQAECEMPIVEVKAITHRDEAIMQDVFPGHADHWNLGGIPKEGSVYNAILKCVPGVRAVHLPASGCGRLSCYIAIEKRFENEPQKAAMAAFIEMPNLKVAVVVDHDIDVFDEREVLWAVNTRTWWDRDLQVIDRVQSFRGWLGSSVVIIDATRSLEGSFPARNEIPPDALNRVDVETALKKEAG